MLFEFNPSSTAAPGKYPVYVVIVSYTKGKNGHKTSGCYFTVCSNKKLLDETLQTLKDKAKLSISKVKDKNQWKQLKEKHKPTTIGFSIEGSIRPINRRKR